MVSPQENFYAPVFAYWEINGHSWLPFRHLHVLAHARCAITGYGNLFGDIVAAPNFTDRIGRSVKLASDPRPVTAYTFAADYAHAL